MTADPPSRHVELASLFNLRDLGGYRTVDGRTVRWRRLFRSDGLQRLGSAELPALAELGIRTVIDLRRPDEVEVARFQGEGVTYHHHSVQPTDWNFADYDESIGTARFLAHRYLEMTSHRGEAIGAVLNLIAASAGAPLAFHCAAGKDRTGVIAALTLSLLGVADEHVAADYALSNSSMERWRHWARVQRPEMISRVDALPGPWITAPAEAIELFLAGLRAEHGTVEFFARSVGVDAAALDRMRADLLEET